MPAFPSILDTDVSLLPFPMVIDNSIRSKLRHCEGQAFYAYLQNIAPTGVSVHLHAGGSFAHGMERVRRAYYVEGRTEQEAIALGVTALLEYYGDYECPPDSAKSAERMAGALVFYFDSFNLRDDYIKPWTDGASHGIEFNFVLPLPVAHPETGEPILYSGRFDMLGQHDNGSRLVVDEKTATQLGATWSRQWGLDSQFTGYCFGARSYGKPVAGALIRGISILKTKYDKAEAIVYRSQWELDRWYAQLVRDVKRMVEMWQEMRAGVPEREIPNWQLDKAACGAYGGCDYSLLCESPHPERWKAINFEPRVWHPMLREEREEELRQREVP